MTIQQLILSVEQAAETLAIHRATIYELHTTDPSFPRIFKTTRRKSGILASELAAWVATQRATRRIDGKVEGSEA
jgi:predicted DNA-binding transcriptional regulator AlpA